MNPLLLIIIFTIIFTICLACLISPTDEYKVEYYESSKLYYPTVNGDYLKRIGNFYELHSDIFWGISFWNEEEAIQCLNRYKQQSIVKRTKIDI